MLVLFESPAGYAVFKLMDEKKLQQTENLFKDFETPEQASKVIKLKHFEKFNDMTDALSAATAAVEGKMTKRLKKLLKKVVVKDTQDQLAVADAKLGNIIKEKLQISCVSNTAVQELMRCIRSQMDSLISGLPEKEMAAMALGLAHSLSRYKLKFSPDKVDTMIIQAVSLLDDLDKELNNYIMRCKEWYGWHFPELSKVISDNTVYVKTVQKIGLRTNSATCDLSDILPDDLEEKVKELAEISMGTEISEEDIFNIKHLCNEILEMQEYRSTLYEYLKNRMMAVAPNLTVLVGDLVGARLISHAGSLLSLAKHPASTVQILGAEKALFRALKSKHDTPKYGLLYHAQLVGQSNPKLKGKASRMLAAKAALACRVDALRDDNVGFEMGAEHKAKLQARMKFLEEGGLRRISGSGKKLAKWEKYENKSEVFQFKSAQDSTLPLSHMKRKLEDEVDASPGPKKIKTETGLQEGADHSLQESSKKRKKKEASVKAEPEDPEHESSSSKKRKKQLEEPVKIEPADESFGADQSLPETSSKKKKKKKEVSINAEPEGQEYGMPADGSSLVESGKKKKRGKKSKPGADDQNDGADEPLDVGKKKKKKKDKHDITNELKSEGEITSQSFEQADTSFDGSGKKKKKHRDPED